MEVARTGDGPAARQLGPLVGGEVTGKEYHLALDAVVVAVDVDVTVALGPGGAGADGGEGP